MLVAQQGHPEEAIRNFRQSLLLRPDYVTALVNLGNLYRHQGSFGEAEKLLGHALGVEPDNPEVNYNLAMLYGQREQSEGGERLHHTTSTGVASIRLRI